MWKKHAEECTKSGAGLHDWKTPFEHMCSAALEFHCASAAHQVNDQQKKNGQIQPRQHEAHLRLWGLGLFSTELLVQQSVAGGAKHHLSGLLPRPVSFCGLRSSFAAALCSAPNQIYLSHQPPLLTIGIAFFTPPIQHTNGANLAIQCQVRNSCANLCRQKCRHWLPIQAPFEAASYGGFSCCAASRSLWTQGVS